MPAVEFKQEYNDNLYFVSSGTATSPMKSDFISTLSPQLTLQRKGEQLQFSLTGRLDRRWYWSTTDLNATDQTYRGNFRYAMGPRYSISGKGDYIQDSRPDRDIQTTGLVLTTAKRNRQVYGLSQEYIMSERTMATLSLDWMKDTYEQTGSTFIDLESRSGSLTFMHDLSALAENTKSMLNFGFSQYSYTEMEINNYSGTVGLSRQLDEKWTFIVSGGARYTYSRFTYQPIFFIPAERVRTYGLGGVGQLAITYKGEKTEASLAAARDLAPAYGQAGAAERTMFSLSMKRKFTYELSGIFSGSYFFNKSDQGDYSATTIDTETLNLSPGLRYDMSKDFYIESTYTYARVKDNASNTVADRNLVMLRFCLQHPLFQ